MRIGLFTASTITLPNVVIHKLPFARCGLTMVYTADVLRLPYNIPIIHKLLRRLPASRLDLSLSHIGKAYRCNFLALIVFNFWQRNGGVGHIGFACTRPTDSRPRFSITVLTITVGARRFQIGRGSDPIFFAIGIWAFHTANISQVYYICQGLRNRFPTRFFAFAANHLRRSQKHLLHTVRLRCLQGLI